ncbi:bifunctional 4-hydroxy-2-oxoglutarate aldolase/2-dehydro-3-deoxy-phosphogluconate aldolase [Prauserella cavernicola]|uniref:Bifunctional 4-hydroxy-2-oxoglutarate aldolase/2-dehydro-3-deoxy-phosphogluconate aldolase n=1 Tax=Prauserella cavernicola TaxID=2800127 RepID=A0A934V401_9PSEU|nr:bifunctional 4-hydroxy-2-oxoglutarate aldolase/2-dehydro-3-deoxy-phosphogluconate aldolase [Prauserella cavernicola]MBK1783595.1 bifunctional 4-hydroxy-2-oxoglutarate aldolase/2-dehydro-3-deoxy-phosphogluconate aldolase [Prauserella cavernicola]
MANDVLSRVLEHRAMVIYRGQSKQQCLELTELLYAQGIRLFEVTLNAGEPFAAISALHEKYGGDLPIGAGTVMTRDDVSRAADAGARFVVCPHVDEAVIERAKELDLGVIPGAFTATEVVRATRLGADLVKVFPIAPVGADYVRQLKGPLPDVPMLATGGVGPDLARECLDAGCAGVGVGVQLLGDPADTAALTEQARRLVAATR